MGRPFTVALQAADASSHGCAANTATTPAAALILIARRNFDQHHPPEEFEREGGQGEEKPKEAQGKEKGGRDVDA